MEKSQHVDFEQERGTCVTLKKELDVVKKKVEMIARSCPKDLLEPFQERMVSFLIQADEKVMDVTSQVEDCFEKYVECMQFMKYMPKKGKVEDTKPEDYFSIWFAFAEEYKNLWKKEQVKVTCQI